MVLLFAFCSPGNFGTKALQGRDLAVADGELLAKLEEFRIHKRLIIQRDREKLTLLVATVHTHPHPFDGKPGSFCCKFNLDVVAAIIRSHVAPRNATLHPET